MSETPDKSTWPEFAIVLFDLLTGRKAELTWVNGAIKLRAREDFAG